MLEGHQEKKTRLQHLEENFGEFDGHAVPEVPAMPEESSEKRVVQNVIRGASKEVRSNPKSTLPLDCTTSTKTSKGRSGTFVSNNRGKASREERDSDREPKKKEAKDI